MSESNATELIKYLTEDNLKLMYGRLNRRYVVVDALPSVDSLEPADKNVIYVVKETVDKAVRYWPNVLDNDAWKPFGIDREDLDRKADKVSNATDGNFAGLDANGNLTDSGFKASDFKPKQTAVTDPAASGSGIEFIDSISQDTNGVIVPAKKSVQVAVASTSGVGGNAGVMSAADKEKLDGIEAGAQANTIESISIKTTPLDITNKNVDIPLATADSDGLLPHEKFPLIPAEPVAGANRIYSFDDTNGTSWQTIVKEYVGNMILDQQGTPVTDEKGDIMYEEEAVPLWLSYKGVEFGARRAYDDHTGTNIHDSIEARTTMAQVTTAIETALANKKERQNELTFDGSATKTVKKITQDANGVINVEFEDVDLKDHIKSEYPIEIKSSASGTYVTLTLDGKVLFVAEYGKTTYTELRKHIERKDILILNVNGTDYCTNYNISDSFIEFYNNVIVNCVNTTKRYVLNSNNVWIYTTDTASKMQLNSGSVSVGEDGTINIGSSNKVTISSPSLNIGTGSLEGSLPTLVYKDIVKNINSNIPLVLFGTNKSDKLQTNSSIPDYSGMTTFFAGYDPSMGPIIDYVNNNVSKLKVLMKNDVTYDSILSMFNASPYLPILNDGTQYYYPHYASPGYGFSWFNFYFYGKDQKMSTIYYYFLSPDNTWSQSYMTIPSEGYDNTDITTIVSSQKVIALLNTETIDIEV